MLFLIEGNSDIVTNLSERMIILKNPSELEKNILKKSRNIRKYIIQNNIYLDICYNCSGVGLEIESEHVSYYCENCRGIGFINVFENYEFNVCPECEGCGDIKKDGIYRRCIKCNGSGILDWIELATEKRRKN